MKEEKSGGVVGEEGECGDDVVRLLARETKFGYIICEERSKAVGEKDTRGTGTEHTVDSILRRRANTSISSNVSSGRLHRML